MTDLRQAAQTAAEALDNKFGKNTVVLDISHISTIADYFVITTASNPNQVSAMVADVEEALENCGVKLKHAEGLGRTDWVLMDFHDIIVHVFDEDSRAFYDLERTWSDAQKI
ncbi:MAG: ribosome silencing factor [Turicibacter sp.]|nr:ribosome silencing factor [Turicibacter sp.]